MQPRQARRPFPAQGCISKILHKGMDGIRWTLVQKRNIQRLQTDFERCVDTVEFPVSQCKPSDTGASESQNGVGVGPRVAAPVKHEQTSISSLIGVPFIVRSHQEVGESKVGDESPNVTKRFKNDNTFKKSGSVRGLLRINPNQLDQETVCGVARNEQEAKDLSDINESDWPSISAYHTRNEDGVSNSESDGKSWSTVLRTVTLPKPVKKVSMVLGCMCTCCTVYVIVYHMCPQVLMNTSPHGHSPRMWIVFAYICMEAATLTLGNVNDSHEFCIY